MVVSQDLQLRYTWINSSAMVVDREDYIGRTDAQIFPGEDGARLTAIKEEVLRTGIETHTEVTVRWKGKVRHFDLVVEPARAGGKLLGVLCSAVETTSLKETIARLQQALDEVQDLKGCYVSAHPARELRMNTKRGKSWRRIFRIILSEIHSWTMPRIACGNSPEYQAR